MRRPSPRGPQISPQGRVLAAEELLTGMEAFLCKGVCSSQGSVILARECAHYKGVQLITMEAARCKAI
ncbi:hypothetical protein ACFX2B_044128 [Malus domestica]